MLYDVIILLHTSQMTNGDVIEPTLPAAEEVPSPTFLEEDSKADPLDES